MERRKIRGCWLEVAAISEIHDELAAEDKSRKGGKKMGPKRNSKTPNVFFFSQTVYLALSKHFPVLFTFYDLPKGKKMKRFIGSSCDFIH